MERALTRREAIVGGVAGAAALYWQGLDDALALATPCGAKLSDIEHVVFLIMENRAFDHYFGTYRGVRGFGDPAVLRQSDGLPVFAQPGYNAPGFDGHLYPFRLNVAANGECVHDIDHTWGPQHRSWNGGRMDGFVREHLADEGANGTVTMGYYTRADIPYYHALADAFTLCDRYHASVIGGSDPNHAYSVSGTIDPAGKHGGPLVVNRPGSTPPNVSVTPEPNLTWTTMPEQLRERGISWKVYSPQTFNNPVITDSPFPMFKQYFSDPDLNSRGLTPRFPDDFAHDVATDGLPQVSWLYADIESTDHPPFSVHAGQHVIDQVVRTLVSNPKLWANTVLFITWDENGAFFDHVVPTTPPPGTTGEYLTVDPLPSDAQGIAGPIGLGFRVPLLIVSPFTRGGFVSSEQFDHTSLLRFLETRFGVEVPNLGSWRRSVTGDLTGAFNFAAKPDASVPNLPPSPVPPESLDCSLEAAEKVTGEPLAPVYPVPPNHMPVQEPGVPRRPQGCTTPHRHKRHRRHRSWI